MDEFVIAVVAVSVFVWLLGALVRRLALFIVGVFIGLLILLGAP